MDVTVFTEVWPGDLPGGLNFTFAAPVDSSSDFDEQLVVARFRSVKRPMLPVRGLARHIVARETLFLNRETGAGLTSLRYYGINTNDRTAWIDLQRGKPLIETSPQEVASLILGQGVQFGRDYHWHVHLKWAGAEIGVQLPTTPEGARALFRLRDYEPGASRRKALVHWVGEHSRRVRKDSDQETKTWVRKHIRGATRFSWQDMEGVIYPSAFDMRQLAATKAGVR